MRAHGSSRELTGAHESIEFVKVVLSLQSCAFRGELRKLGWLSGGSWRLLCKVQFSLQRPTEDAKQAPRCSLRAGPAGIVENVEPRTRSESGGFNSSRCLIASNTRLQGASADMSPNPNDA